MSINKVTLYSETGKRIKKRKKGIEEVTHTGKKNYIITFVDGTESEVKRWVIIIDETPSRKESKEVDNKEESKCPTTDWLNKHVFGHDMY